MKHLLWILLFCAGVAPVAAADIENPRTRQDGNRAIITYDLIAEEPVAISVRGSGDGGASWDLTLNHLSGDVGNNVSPGRGKTIVWEALRDYPRGVNLSQLVFELASTGGLPAHRDADIGIELVHVAGGCFQMGSVSGDADEKPLHDVCVDGFAIGKYEVTQRQWQAVMGTNPSQFEGDDLPVERVDWNEVHAFIQKLNERTGMRYRLPTEAEWEYAAKGGSRGRDFKYAGSDDVSAVGWYLKNSSSRTHPVGEKEPNELGLYDMSGNVWEWVDGWYSKDYYSISPRDNPTGPADGSEHIYRGGSCVDYPGYLRTANRHHTPSGFLNKGFTGLFRANTSIGFRLAKDL